MWAADELAAVEPLADPADVAANQSLLRNDVASQAELNRVRAQMRPQSHPDFDGIHCVECGSGIPLERLDDGRILCTDCQQYAENRLAHRRRTLGG